ncbi:CD209 antigen-like isoform X1 [Podarcis raffonei]|uniref:CD209 antigen-like isoform X1 n=1 Tax=Podarcis raffonei TaxID=65483 RepID=UPI00232987AC|nr:CD209 antigen-like isoform X1 [Podarcis raffonei]
MGKLTPAKSAASRKHAMSRRQLALRKRKAAAKETGASLFQELVIFFKSPTGERLIILEIFILTAMTLLIYILYQKEANSRAEVQIAMDIIRTFVVGLDTIHEDKDDQKEVKNREEFQVAMTMIRNFVVGIDSFYEDKDDFGILAVALNKSEEMRYLANKNDELQKEIDLLIGNLNGGWFIYQRTMYFLSPDQSSWADSQKRCEREGAKLISMETVEEQNFINAEVQKRNKFFWFGVFKDKEKKWRWLSGIETIITYWKKDEPKNEDRNHCAAVGLDCGMHCWIALHCEQRIGYICKKVPDDTWL